MSRLRTLLVLGRVSNLPTIWSNCLAGWWLGGAGNQEDLPFLFAGVTCLYLGGMFLNDAFDVPFDRQHRRERPIPSGAISERAVWRWGFVWLALGMALLFQPGLDTGMTALGLLVCLLLYDAIHKLVNFSPLLIATCRFLVYLVAASTAARGITGWSIWCGLALAAYVSGLSYLARRESARWDMQYWPLMALSVPIPLALVMNAGQWRQAALLLSLILALWIARSLRYALRASDRRIGRAVSYLLAGIVVVDWLAVPDVAPALSLVFLALFALTLLLQRFIPAT